jgi:hypothetical protein
MLPEIKIASPCTASWELMTGDNQSRHCSECNRNVYNFSEMTSKEIEQLIAASNGDRLCARLYRRTDGTILTSDCPVGLRARIRTVSRRVSAALAAVMSIGCTVKPALQGVAVFDNAAAATGFDLSVVDQLGGAVAQAQITVTSLKSRQVVATGKTSETGKVSFPLEGGDYAIVVERAGLPSQSISASIKQHEMKPVTVKVQNAHHLMGKMILRPSLKNLQKNN